MGEKMSIRRQKIALQIRNFKNVMRQIVKNKKSLVGLIILIFFAAVAAFGPLFTTLDPIGLGSVHNPSVDLPAAEANCVPSWYTGENITQNINVIPNPYFDSPSDLDVWKRTTTEGITVEYNASIGSSRNGSIEISFSESGNATLSINFQYPYKNPPVSFKGKLSYYLTAMNEAPKNEANITILTSFIRQEARIRTYQSSMPLLAYFTSDQMNNWFLVKNEIDSSNARLISLYQSEIGKYPVNAIFSKPANYTFEINVQFNGNASELGNPTLYLDDIQLIIYGNSFGLLGTDWMGRDIFTQLIIGTRISFTIGIVAAILSVGIGLIYGLTSAYMGGVADEIMMRFNDLLLVIPTLPLLLVMVYVVGQSMMNIIIVVGVLGWMGFARTVRSAVLSLKERPFIEAAKATGAGRLHIMSKHIIPNVIPLVYVTLAMSVPSAIISEAALSWLGLGPLDVMSWGRILYEFEMSGTIATGALTKWYWVIPPGISICLLSLSFVLIGYALDEIFNPKLRERR
jgi:ABC-type dipeptide/oligopeptide/nickel transport system permease subunit